MVEFFGFKIPPTKNPDSKWADYALDHHTIVMSGTARPTGHVTTCKRLFTQARLLDLPRLLVDPGHYVFAGVHVDEM